MRVWRAFALGLLLAPVNAYWVIQMERVRAGPYVSSISLFANAVFVLALLVALNHLVRRLRPRAAFSAGELLLVYSMVSLATSVAGIDFIQVLMMILGHAKKFASPENQWESFFPYLPKWLVVQDLPALERYHSGHSSLWLPENYRPYLLPCGAWLSFVAALLVTMQGLAALFARPWIERERLTFPVLEMPMALAVEPPSFFRNPFFVFGAGISTAWCLLNGLHFLFPAVPQISVWPGDLVRGATSKPIRAMVWMPVTFYPFAIGLGYLLPTDLLFSAWFFYLFWKCELALTALLAWDVNPRMPYPPQQALGACVALVAYHTWTMRGYLREVLVGLRRRGPSAAHCGEYRAALLATGLGIAYLVAFSRVAGMSWEILIPFWLIYAVTVTIVTRMRAELGPPVHDFHKMGADAMLVTALGSQNIGGRDLGILSLYWWINRAYRGLPMAHQIEGLKAAHDTHLRPAWFHVGMVLAGVVGAAAAMISYLYLAFKLGAASGFHSGFGYGWENFGQLMSFLQHPTRPDWASSGAIGVGLLFSLLMLVCRLRFLGWPFHPIGFAISACWSINLVWLPLLIAWVVKVSVIRWGGLRLYVKLRPFFLGLILGDCLMGSLWPLIGLVWDVPNYSFWGA